MPKHHKMHMQYFNKSLCITKVKFKITELFMVLKHYCVLNLTNLVTLIMNLVLLIVYVTIM